MDDEVRTFGSKAPGAITDRDAPELEINIVGAVRDDLPPLGLKHDTGKPRWDLLPMHQLEQIVRVLTVAVSGDPPRYVVDSWQHVEDARRRYFAAAMRHLSAWREGETFDPDDGLPHLAHAGACLLFLQWFDDNRPEDE